MLPTTEPDHPHGSSTQRILVAGLLTLIPLWLTWLVVSFLFETLTVVGSPLVEAATTLAKTRFPGIDPYLSNEVVRNVVAIIFVVAIIYLVGLLTLFVAGRKLVAFFESLLNRLPLVKNVYGSVKQLTTVLQGKPATNVERIVLLNFPSRDMKSVGIVTRVFNDAGTGRELAAVYVPTTPVPTSGYLEIVPLDQLTPTDWTMDEAMNFVVSGGAVAPSQIFYDRADKVIPEEISDSSIS
ncbi:MAG: DUF502 domain-containing protein [Verrucomicrobiales bacterium]|nr:DUF502 domain-containing protein [Verrucomicrobiales bacterium]